MSAPADHPRGSDSASPLDPADEAGLDAAEAIRAERDDLRRRLDEAEQIAEDLAEELGQARARLDELQQRDAAQAASNGARDGRLPLFDDNTDTPDGLIRSVDGSDRLVLPIALAATALVVFLVALLSLANNGFLDLFSIGTLIASGGLARAAWLTRIVPVEVWVDRGVVLIRRGDASLSFDLSSPSLKFEVTGRPGDDSWRVRFYRRGLEPVDVDATMVDPDAFMAQLDRYRPQG